jgi:formylglycine-generating enzyme required for sulfatase activity
LTFGTTSFELKKGDKPRLKIEYIAGKVHVTKDGAALPVIPKTHATNGAAELPAAPQTTVAPAGSIAADGFALEFNGKDSYVDLPTLHYDGSHPITIEATIVPYQAVAQGVVVGDREKEASPSGVALKFPIDDGLSPKAGAFVVGNGSRFHGAKSRDGIIPKRRIQVAGVREGSMIRLFMDGKLQSTSEIEGYRPRSGPFNIGASNPGEGSAAMSFSGIIDEVRISRVARYEADYTPLPRLETDEHTMALYHFDEGAGDVSKDSSANNHNGQIVRAKWVRADGSPIQLAAGWHGWPADAPPPAIAPFDAAQAIKHQEAWAKYLGLPVEWENSLGMKFRLIPPGEFTMGASQAEIDEGLGIVKGDPKYDQDQIRASGPPHRVILSQPIYLAAHEVTQAQYEAVIGKNPSAYAATGRFPEKVALVKGLDTSGHPVDGVSWNDAAEFSAELSEREKLGPRYFRAGDAVTVLEGNGYRLPSEATWEFACRGGTTSRYWSGDRNDDLVRVGWFGMNSGARTHTVGETPANPFGLFDMHGNVMEWCQDWWDPDYYPRSGSEAAHDPAGPMTGTQRTKRGGGWGNYNCICRSAIRGSGRPADGAAIIGFRLALPVVAVQQRIAADGFALEFNGKDSYVELPTLKYDGSHPVTIEAWATPGSLRETGYSFIVDNVDEGHGGDQYWPAGLGLQQRALGDGTNCWGAWLSTDKPPAAHNQIVGSPAHWSIGRTAHLTLQFANDQAQLYVDGKLVNERRFPDRHRASKRRFVIGNRFAGQVHAVRISGIVRYPSSFIPRTHLERDKHTLALYDFAEGQGDLLTDLSGNEHHGKIVGATWVKAVANSSAQAPSGPAATNK